MKKRAQRNKRNAGGFTLTCCCDDDNTRESTPNMNKKRGKCC